MLRLFAVAMASCTLLACASSPPTITGDGKASPTVTFPLQGAWHSDQRVFYISTDISDSAMATMMGSNFAPRLADAVPSVPRPPGEKSALERVYKFPDDSQEAVFASVPNPVGPTSRDAVYSPLWQVFWVTWKSGRPVTLLKSEEAILAAQEQGDLDVARTGIVINCPIVGTETGALPGVKILRR